MILDEKNKINFIKQPLLYIGWIKMESWYDKEVDILNIQIQDEGYWKSIELPNGVIIDVSKEGKIIAIEILRASKIFSGDVRNVIEHAKIHLAEQILLKFYQKG